MEARLLKKKLPLNGEYRIVKNGHFLPLSASMTPALWKKLAFTCSTSEDIAKKLLKACEHSDTVNVSVGDLSYIT